MTVLRLRTPSRELLPEYANALETGWSPTTTRDVSGEQLKAIRADQETFLRELMDQAGTVVLPDGTEVPRIPFKPFWLWDGEFCG